MRTGGAEALAFDVTCLVGPEGGAAARRAAATGRSCGGRCSCSTSGPQVDGYRSDMTRTLFVGEPTERDLAVYELVATAQAAAIRQIEATRRRRAGRCRRAATLDGSPAG